MLSFCPSDNSAGVGAFVIGLSQISSFFSYIMGHPVRILSVSFPSRAETCECISLRLSRERCKSRLEEGRNLFPME